MSKAHVMNKYEASSGFFRTSIIFVEIKAAGGCHFWKKKGQMTFYQPVYTNVFRNVVRKFIRWFPVKHLLLFQEHSQIQSAWLCTEHSITKLMLVKLASCLEQLNSKQHESWTYASSVAGTEYLTKSCASILLRTNNQTTYRKFLNSNFSKLSIWS